MHLIKPGRQDSQIAWELQSCEQSATMHECVWNDPMASHTTCADVVELLLP